MTGLLQKKRSPQRSAPLLGLGVTAACDFTGAPAVDVDKDGRYVSAEVQAKQRAGASDGPGNARLLEYLGDIRLANFEFVYDFNQLGEREESSYLAVVHTDGNRMGERIQFYVNQFVDDDMEFISAQRKFSVKVQEAAHAALVSSVGLLLAPKNLAWDKISERNRIGGEGGVPVPIDRDGVERLPFRPIVFGGDDVTFVCEGRLGLPLAAHYLSRLAAETLPDGEPLYARVGVAIVKTYYPFARAYELADELSSCSQTTDRRDRRQDAASSSVGLALCSQWSGAATWRAATSGICYRRRHAAHAPCASGADGSQRVAVMGRVQRHRSRVCHRKGLGWPAQQGQGAAGVAARRNETPRNCSCAICPAVRSYPNRLAWPAPAMRR